MKQRTRRIQPAGEDFDPSAAARAEARFAGPTDLTVTGLAKALPYSWAEQEQIGLCL